MYDESGRELRRCQARLLGGYGDRCKKFSNSGSNLCNIHLAADNRKYPDEATKAFNKVVSKRNKLGYRHRDYRCNCAAYPFPHHAAAGLCRWPRKPKQRLECEPNEEAKALRRKLRRQGLVVNTVKEKMESGIGENSRIVDLDCDSDDLSLEQDYLAKIKYEVDVLSLSIEERRKIQKQKMIAEYMLKIGKADIDGVESNYEMIEDDCDLIEIAGEVYRLK